MITVRPIECDRCFGAGVFDVVGGGVGLVPLQHGRADCPWCDGTSIGEWGLYRNHQLLGSLKASGRDHFTRADAEDLAALAVAYGLDDQAVGYAIDLIEGGDGDILGAVREAARAMAEGSR